MTLTTNYKRNDIDSFVKNGEIATQAGFHSYQTLLVEDCKNQKLIYSTTLILYKEDAEFLLCLIKESELHRLFDTKPKDKMESDKDNFILAKGTNQTIPVVIMVPDKSRNGIYYEYKKIRTFAEATITELPISSNNSEGNQKTIQGMFIYESHVYKIAEKIDAEIPEFKLERCCEIKSFNENFMNTNFFTINKQEEAKEFSLLQ